MSNGFKQLSDHVLQKCSLWSWYIIPKASWWSPRCNFNNQSMRWPPWSCRNRVSRVNLHFCNTWSDSCLKPFACLEVCSGDGTPWRWQQALKRVGVLVKQCNLVCFKFWFHEGKTVYSEQFQGSPSLSCRYQELYFVWNRLSLCDTVHCPASWTKVKKVYSTSRTLCTVTS
jgi:hypothetical protein